MAGELSADGSRMWNGNFWVLVRRGEPVAESPARDPGHEPAAEFFLDRSFGFLGMIAAALVGLFLTHLQFTLPAFGAPSVQSALTELLIAQVSWILISYGTVILILSLGRRAIDVLLLRAMIVAFVLGAGFIGLVPLGIHVSLGDWLKAVAFAGLVWAALLGPVLAVYATIANLIWYRSYRSLRPALPFFRD